MMTCSGWLARTASTAMAVVLSTTPLLARGGAASIMNSPGYQRRLQESRQQLPEPRVQPPLKHRHKPYRHGLAAPHSPPA